MCEPPDAGDDDTERYRAMKIADLQFAALGSAFVAGVSGELDYSNAEDIGTAIVEAVPEDTAKVVLDLTKVKFIDSVGICVILGLRKCLEDRGQRLALVIGQRSVIRRTLGLVGVTSSVPTEATIDSAVRVLSQPEPSEVSSSP